MKSENLSVLCLRLNSLPVSSRAGTSCSITLRRKNETVAAPERTPLPCVRFPLVFVVEIGGRYVMLNTQLQLDWILWRRACLSTN